MAPVRSVGVVTVGRTDWNLWRPVLDEIRTHADLDLRLYVTSMHLSPEFGYTIRDIEADGFKADEKIELLMSSDSPQGVAMAMGLGNIGFAQVFARTRPDMLLVLGDRFETLSAVTAALPFAIPVAHLYGGEATEGAIDELTRHAITKLSHLHFTSTQQYADRVCCALGEEPWRVAHVGATSIDEIKRTEVLSRDVFTRAHGLDPEKPFLLVTLHPVTLDAENTEAHVRCVLEALEQFGMPVLLTYPNADTSGRIILEHLKKYQARYPGTPLVASLHRVGYYSALKHAAAMVGNSSSGIVEAPSYALPVINIGDRQKGRVRARNVIDVSYEPEAILRALGRSQTAEFRRSLEGIENPYGDGHASKRIVDVIRTVSLDKRLLTKTLQHPPL